MTIPMNQQVYTQGSGTSGALNIAIPIFSPVSPSAQDVNYPLGKRWVNQVLGSEYSLTSFSSANGTITANWAFLGSSSGDLNSLNGNSGTATPASGAITVLGVNGVTVTGAGNTLTVDASVASGILSLTGDAASRVTPTAGNVNTLGTTSQISVVGVGATLTWSLPTTVTAPGSVTTTTSLAAGSTLTSAGATTLATTGASVNTFGNATGATSVGITSGSGGIALTATNAALTANSGTGALGISTDAAATTVNIATGASVKAVTIGSTTGGSGVTVNGGLGGITLAGATAITGNAALTGNLTFTTAGNKIKSTSVATTTTGGANSVGSVALSSGTATVTTTAVTSASLIDTWVQSIGATGASPVGRISLGTIVDGTSFVINSTSFTDATSLVTTDKSVIGWMIIN